jgi:hypothetical protein
MACRGCSSGDGCECSVVGSADGAITMAGSGAPITSPYTPTFNFDVVLDALTEDLTACEDLNDPQVPVLLGDGSVIRTPLPCAADFLQLVPGNAFAFNFSGTTTDADPGDGFLRLNNATYSSATQIFVDLFDTNSVDVTAWLDSLDDLAENPKGRVRLYSRADQTNWVDFTLTGVTAAAGYRKLAVSFNDSNGTLSVTTGDTVLDFAPAGSTAVSVTTITSVDSPYSPTVNQNVVLADTTGGSITINLPAANTALVPLTYKKIAAANTLTIDPNGAETIDGSATAVITEVYTGVTLVSDGSNWFVI